MQKLGKGQRLNMYMSKSNNNKPQRATSQKGKSHVTTIQHSGLSHITALGHIASTGVHMSLGVHQNEK